MRSSLVRQCLQLLYDEEIEDLLSSSEALREAVRGEAKKPRGARVDARAFRFWMGMPTRSDRLLGRLPANYAHEYRARMDQGEHFHDTVGVRAMLALHESDDWTPERFRAQLEEFRSSSEPATELVNGRPEQSDELVEAEPEPGSAAVIELQSSADVDSTMVADLVASLRQHARVTADGLVEAAGKVAAGVDVASSVTELVASWARILEESWATFGVNEVPPIPAFEVFEALRERLVEQEADERAREAEREANLSHLETLRKLAAGLEGVAAVDRTYRKAYERALSQIAELEHKVGNPAGRAERVGETDLTGDTSDLARDASMDRRGVAPVTDSNSGDATESASGAPDYAVAVTDRPTAGVAAHEGAISRRQTVPEVAKPHTDTSASERDEVGSDRTPSGGEATNAPTDTAAKTQSSTGSGEAALDEMSYRTCDRDNNASLEVSTEMADACTDVADQRGAAAGVTATTLSPANGLQIGGDEVAALRELAEGSPAAEADASRSETAAEESQRGLAVLVSNDEWAAASALAPLADLDGDIVQALDFCAESFCLPIISTNPHEMLGRNAGLIAAGVQSSGTAALITVVGLLRVCLSVGREQSWLITEESLDCLPGAWHDVARELRDAAADGYQHPWDQAMSVNSAVTPSVLKRQADELKETLPKRGNKYAPAGNVLRHMMNPGGDLFLALEAVSNWVDGSGDADSLRARRALLDDPRKLVDRVDSAISGKSKPKKSHIVSGAFDSLTARITEVAALLDHAIVLAEAGSATHNPVSGALGDKVRKLTQNLPEVELDGTLDAAVLGRFRAWMVGGSGPSSNTGRSYTQLKFVSTLPAFSAVRDQQLNLPVRSDISAQKLIEEVLHPLPHGELFHAYLARGNFAAAVAIGIDDDNALALRAAEREWRSRIQRRGVDLQSELLRLHAQTQVDSVTRAQLDGQISALKTFTDNRFDLASSRADEIVAQFQVRWEHAMNELSASLREREATVGVASADAQRIWSLIQQHDFITAREFMSQLSVEGGEGLPRAQDDGLMALQEFRALLEEWPGETVSAARVVEDCLGGPPPEQVATALRAWSQGGRARKTSEWESLLPTILELLGLEMVPGQTIVNKTARNQIRFGKFGVKAKPKGGSYIAALGSKARLKGYSVYVLAPDTSVESIFDQIPTGERREANLVLYPGVLSWEELKALRASADKEKFTALIIDSAVIAHMAIQPERLFTTLQRISLPFSTFAHWAPRVAGDVPDELFVGRAELIDKIVSPEGSIFVYGGRQLGKSALLHRIERDFNRIHNRLAIYIDFKVERIGEENEPEYLWTVLRNRLQDAKIIPAANTSTKAEAIEKAIREWLEGDPERAILLLCDETDAFLQTEARERVVNNRVGSFPNVTVLKGLMDKSQRRFKPVFAGLHQVQRIAGIPNSPLAHGGEDILVGPLSSAEAWELVVRPFKALGYQFESLDLVWRLLAFTNHHAGLVQIVCDELYKKMRTGQRRIPAGQPPYLIVAADVDSVITSRDVRDFIAERFRLTIQLEDRYFVIAIVVALFGLERGFENRYSRSEILEICRLYWPGGFNAVTEEELSVYLDEMVGLNVLIQGNDDTHYGMRSPNVVHMLGDPETLERQLLDGRFELPLQYNARVSRRRLSRSRDREEYSPLTEYELSRVMPKRNGARDRYAVAVIGSPALGIGKLGHLLTVASQEDYEYNLEMVSADNAKDLVLAGTGAFARRPLIVCDAVERPDVLHEAVERIKAASTDSIGRRAVLLGAFGASSRDELVAQGVEVIPLQRWTVETVRATIDNPITNPGQRDDFVAATGGWPMLCEESLNKIRAGSGVTDVIAQTQAFPNTVDQARQFLSAVGLTDEHDQKLLGPWASFVQSNDVVDEDTLGELLEVGADEMSNFLNRLSVLSVISEQTGGYVLNEVVRRCLLVVGATDEG